MERTVLNNMRFYKGLLCELEFFYSNNAGEACIKPMVHGKEKIIDNITYHKYWSYEPFN